MDVFSSSNRARSREPERLFAGKWLVERVIGRGGMGFVVAARHARLGHRVALKVLGHELREHAELVTRFEREARAASSLTSSHAVKVLDIDTAADGTPYLVMELLEGCDLAAVLERGGPMPPGRAVRWILEACDAIAEAHRRGIVHRDLKPSNLFLARRDDGVPMVKVLDFGIAKTLASNGHAALTGDVAPLGTPHYMSPEQVRCARDVDARSDVWSLGATLFELLTGEPPYPQEESSACIAAIAADPVRDPRVLQPDLPEELVLVVARALSKDPDARPRDAGELAALLAPLADPAPPSGEEIVAARAQAVSAPDATRIESVPPSSERRPPRRRAPPALAMAAGIVALVGLPKCVAELSRPPAAARRVTPVEVEIAGAHLASRAVVAKTNRPSASGTSSDVGRAAPPRARVTPVVARDASPAEVVAVHGGLRGPGF